MGGLFWLKEHDDALKAALAAKMSFSQAAAELNAKHGTTYSRNATAGRANRLGLKSLCPKSAGQPRRRRQRKGEATAIGIVERTRRKAEHQFKCEPMTGLRIADVVPLNISIYELTDQTCKWPYGDNPPFVYCGLPVFESCSYCADHVALSTRPWQAKPLERTVPPSVVQSIIPSRKVA
ncbi:MAG TPA: GcrA family cell cycle regulator [Sphingomicrobium sp.]|nr:GcrA family cell cycle regulator [Sphingomicrobium sp.]